jgi:hypothetical protein
MTPTASAGALGRNGLRIICLGYLVRGPMGGMTWHYLQYALGLARLGHDVYFVEDSDDYPSCYDPSANRVGTDPAYGLAYAARVFDRVGLHGRLAYYDAHTSRWLGPCADRVRDVCATADLLLNLSGVNPLRPWLLEVPVRALVDTDPVFTQVRHLTEAPARELAGRHTAFFTFGENLVRAGSAVPQDGLPWRATRQPVVLEAWPVTPGPVHGRYTTVMTWEGCPPAKYGGLHYGLKSDSFGPYLDLPERAGPVLEVAGTGAPEALLASKGWVVRNPLEEAPDPWAYQAYIQRSKAEFSIVKHAYVVSRSGWFSERSAGYLASGRPVLVQETGFSDWLETGRGVLAFRTPEEALAGIEEINGRYAFHCRVARDVAEAYFDARKVLTALVESALCPARGEGAASGAPEPPAPGPGG